MVGKRRRWGRQREERKLIRGKAGRWDRRARDRRLFCKCPFKPQCLLQYEEVMGERKRTQGEGRGISNLGILMGSCAGLNYAPRGGGRSGAQQNEHVTRPPGPVTPLCAAKTAAAGRAIPADATVQTRAGTNKVLCVPRRPPTYSASLVPHSRLKASPLRTQD